MKAVLVYIYGLHSVQFDDSTNKRHTHGFTKYIGNVAIQVLCIAAVHIFVVVHGSSVVVW